MPYESLRDFIARLEQAGRLKRVSVPVDPHLEMTEIQTRLLAEQGPAILFEQPVGRDGKRYEMPMLVNLFGTVERVAWGMDREPNELRAVGETLAFLKQPEPPRRLARSDGDVAAGEDRAGDEAEDRRLRAVPGRGADRRRDRSRAACRSRPAGRASRRR